jgi:hypothetical protein
MTIGKTLEKTFWIMGAGKFGRLAALRLGLRFKKAKLLVVDQDPQKLENLPCVGVQADAVPWLVEHLNQSPTPEWIVPAVPVHLAYHFIAARLEADYSLRPLPIAPAIKSRMPGAFDGQPGQVYISNADFICPDNCPEPKDHCPVTGKPRPRELFRYLQTLNGQNIASIVIRSHQLLPGVGGYRPEALFKALTAVRHARRPILLSTACRCHGVANCFDISSK